jgi:hypothetical protein
MRNLLFVALMGLVAALLIGCNLDASGKVTLPVPIPDQSYDSGAVAPPDGSVFQSAPIDVTSNTLWSQYQSHIKSIDKVTLTGTLNNESTSTATLSLYVSDTGGLTASQKSQMTYLTDVTVAAGSQTVNKAVDLNETVNTIIRDGKFTLYGFGAVSSAGQPVKLSTTNMRADIGVTVNISVN